MERITIPEFKERCVAQGMAREDLAFTCPVCGTTQSLNSLKKAGASDDLAEKYIGFSCEGRVSGAGPWPRNPSPKRRAVRGCDWTLGGLFKIHKLEVVGEDGKIHPHFEFATEEQARVLRSLRHAK